MSKVRICDICGAELFGYGNHYRVRQNFLWSVWGNLDVCDSCWTALKSAIKSKRENRRKEEEK